MGAAADRTPARARIRRPGADRIRAARASSKNGVRLEARHRFLALFIVLVGASILSPVFATLSPTRTFTIASGSMEPTIPKGSLVWAKDGEPNLGDVVVYEAPTQGYQVHRIIDIVDVEGSPQYVTRGDANDAADSFLVQPGWIVGIVTRDVPFLGNLWLIPLATQALVFFLGIALYVGISLWDARILLNGPRFRFTLAGIVMVLLVPMSWAATVTTYPINPHAAGRISSRTPFAVGDMGAATIDPGLAYAGVTLATPTLWKEAVIWGCTTGSACTVTAPGLSAYATQAGGVVHINVADFNPVPTFYFEAFLAAPSGATINARLIDKTTALEVSGSVVSTTSTTPVAVRSAALTLTGDKDYQVQIMNTGLVSGGTFYQAKLLMSQQYPTKTQSQVFVSGASTTTSILPAAASKSFRWTYDANGFDGITSATFETIVEVSGVAATGTFTLYDVTAGAAAASLTSSSTVTATRVSGTFSTALLVDQHEYEVRISVTAALNPTATVHVARVILQQESFTKSVRYVDLSWPTTSTSTSFTSVGYSGAYEMASEWGGLTGYFEAWMSASSGQTASAELYNEDAAQTIASSQVDTTNTATTRVRSAAVTLVSDSSDYRARIKATSGTVSLQHAWFIAFQTVGKTYDHVLEATHDVVNACSWASSFHAVSSSNLARIANAQIDVRTDAGTATQVVIVGGTITQSSGSTFTMAYADWAEFTAFYKPSSVGPSTLETELRATCTGYGIHTVQSIAFTLA